MRRSCLPYLKLQLTLVVAGMPALACASIAAIGEGNGLDDAASGASSSA